MTSAVDDIDRATVAAIHKYLELGYRPRNLPTRASRGEVSAVNMAARELDLTPRGMRDRVMRAAQHGHHIDWSRYKPLPNAKIELDPEAQEAPEDRAEIRNTTFWRNKAKALDEELHKTELALSEIAGLRDLPIKPPKWTLPSTSGKRRKSMIGLLVSDVHMGEVVREDEILGLNAFDVEICERRLRRMFGACCQIGSRWTADTENTGAVLFLTGDLISGDIHEELKITNACTSHEQVQLMVGALASGIVQLKEAFGWVLVVSVPGNHGRTTIKPTAKLYSLLSYDTLIASILRDRFKDDSKVVFQIGSSVDQLVPMVGFPFLQTHGDKMGTGGGQGFAGPMLPIVRGAKKVEHQQSRAGRTTYWIVHGHYHTSGQPGNVFSNGSVPGYTEYGNGLRASLEAPQQWMWLVHELWGVRERLEIKLEDSLVLRKSQGHAWL